MNKLISISSVDNTNNQAKRYRQESGNDRFSLTAERQSDAKVRYNRKWLTPYENIAVTLAIPSPAECTSLLPFYFLSQLTVARTIKQFVGHADVKIKWPNDIFVEGKKISATLIEYDQQTIFIGININHAILRFDVGCPAVDLRLYSSMIQKEEVVDSLIDSLARNLAILKTDAGKNRMIYNYQSWMYGIDELMEISLDSDRLHRKSGICKGIDCDGKILLQNEDGIITAWSVYDAVIKK